MVTCQFGCKMNKELRLKAEGGHRGVLLRATGNIWFGGELYEQLDVKGCGTSCV